MNQKILILKQKDDQGIWVRLRNLVYFEDRELFDDIEKHTYELLSESKRNKENTATFKKEDYKDYGGTDDE